MKYNTGMKIFIIALTTVLLILAILCVFSYLEYRRTFFARMSEPTGFTAKYLSDHGVKHADFSCPSSRGPLICGIRLIPEGEPKALIVMTHGFNLSSEHYVSLAHFFTNKGYEVLLFDGIGVGMSDGTGIYGLPQQISNMKSVLDAVMDDPELSAMPLLLFGHSWGGYAAACVSYLGKYPVLGIITCAAFRKSSSSMYPTVKRRYPRGTAGFVLFWTLVVERIICGRTSSFISSKGLSMMGCPARVYHSTDDTLVYFDESFKIMREELKDDPKVEFIQLNGRNHDLIFPPENDRRQRDIAKALRTAEGEARDQLISELWQLMSETDEDLAEDFVNFYDKCIEQQA